MSHAGECCGWFSEQIIRSISNAGFSARNPARTKDPAGTKQKKLETKFRKGFILAEAVFAPYSLFFTPSVQAGSLEEDPAPRLSF